MPAPLGEVFPTTDVLLSVSVPELRMPPPAASAALPEMTQLVNVNVPEFQIPPPELAPTPPTALPLAIVNPKIVTTVTPVSMVSMRKFGVPAAGLR
jgi:hypothetical protein